VKTLIIAEAGVNHNGNLQMAKDLVEAAINASVDIVKFQTFKAENLSTKSAAMAAYQKKNTRLNESQLSMLKRLELTNSEFLELQGTCAEKGIEFLSTAFDLESLDFLWSLGPQRIKIPSGEITNLPYLRKVGSLGIETILSTGMAQMQEIEEALNVLELAGTSREKIVVLHCTTNYPTEMHEVNLQAMRRIGNEFGVKFGYSDHTLGIEVSIAAVALGACVIEKHFTLSRDLEGPDHRASLEPTELANMVNSIRNIEVALGEGVKRPTTAEIENAKVARKSIVARKEIKQGEIFTNENLTTKRPGVGLSPMMWDSILGSVASRDFDEDELIEI
jgi:N,N'-diacetyllegionaminate synthase